MKKEIAKLWVDALRSGKYKQGGAYLRRTDDRFCCLGVLCDIAEREGIVKAIPTANGYFEYEPSGQYSGLPKPVVEWAGMKPQQLLGFYAKATNLANDNDNSVLFPEIADIIEQNVEAL